MADKNFIPRVFLISTALWVLGAYYFDPPKKGTEKNERRDGKSSSTNDFDSYGLSTKTAKSSQEKLKSASKDLQSLGNESSSRIGLRRRIEVDDEREVGDTASPNWGFYVAITPEQQEMYAKAGSPWRGPSNLQSS